MRYLRLFHAFVLIGALVSSLCFTKPAKAFDTCSPNTATNNPTSSVWHATWSGSPWNIYMDQYQYLLSFTNNSGHTCHVVFDVFTGESGGWYIDDYYRYNTAKGHQPYMVINPSSRTCIWTDDSHRNAVCDFYVVNGTTGTLRMNWVHNAPYNNEHSTAAISIWTEDTSGDYLQLSNNNWDVY